MKSKTFTAGIVISLVIHAAILIYPRVSGNEGQSVAKQVKIGLVYLATTVPSAMPQPALVNNINKAQAETKTTDKPSPPITSKNQQTPSILTPEKQVRVNRPPERPVKIQHQPADTKINPITSVPPVSDILTQQEQTDAKQPDTQISAAHTNISLANTSEKLLASVSHNIGPTNDSEHSIPQPRILACSPRYHINPPPHYPSLAKMRHWQGEVWLRILVGEQGEVVEVWVENSSGHSLLDEAALKTVRTWKFHPGNDGKKNIQQEVHLPIRFQLEQS